MCSSDLMGGDILLLCRSFPFIADQQRAGLSASSAPPMGRDGYNYFFSFLIVPPHQLLYQIAFFDPTAKW